MFRDWRFSVSEKIPLSRLYVLSKSFFQLGKKPHVKKATPWLVPPPRKPDSLLMLFSVGDTVD